MKILFATTTLARFSGDPLGGIGNCFFDLYQELSNQVQVDVVTPLMPNSSKYEKFGNLTIYRESPVKSYGSFESMIKTLQVVKIPILLINMYRRLLKLSNQNNYDVIHGFFIVPAGLLVSLLPTKAKKIISALGSDVHTLSYKPLMPPIYQFIFRKTDGVIYNTTSMKNRLDQLQARNLEYIPTPLDRDVFKLQPTLTKKPHFVFLGRLTKAKGVWILLQSFKQVLKVLPQARLTIIGDGPEKNAMAKFVSDNKLNQAIFLADTLNSKEIAKALKELGIEARQTKPKPKTSKPKAKRKTTEQLRARKEEKRKLRDLFRPKKKEEKIEEKKETTLEEKAGLVEEKKEEKTPAEEKEAKPARKENKPEAEKPKKAVKTSDKKE